MRNSFSSRSSAVFFNGNIQYFSLTRNQHQQRPNFSKMIRALFGEHFLHLGEPPNKCTNTMSYHDFDSDIIIPCMCSSKAAVSQLFLIQMANHKLITNRSNCCPVFLQPVLGGVGAGNRKRRKQTVLWVYKNKQKKTKSGQTNGKSKNVIIRGQMVGGEQMGAV